MIDLQCWAPLPKAYADRQYHAHNRLLCSVGTTDEERRRLAREIAKRLGASIGPTAFLLPTRGLQAWDLPEQPMHLPAAHAALVAEFRSSIKAPVELHDLDLHINDPAFSAHALDIFDRWVAEGRIPRAANWAQQARN